MALAIRFLTYQTVPPRWLNFIYSLLATFMSIMWVSLASDLVIECVTILGVIINAPEILLLFTLLSVGNCVGDMNANIAMTKKGFGEMAVTASLAGPIFIMYVAIGTSILLAVSSSSSGDDGLKSMMWPKD